MGKISKIKIQMQTQGTALNEINMASQDNKELDKLSKAKVIIENLEIFDKSYFNKDRNKKMKEQIDEALGLIEAEQSSE